MEQGDREAGHQVPAGAAVRRFHGIGEFRDIEASPDGKLLSKTEWAAKRDQWLPSKPDGDFIDSLMQPSWERGKYANWIAPPKVGIDGKSGDFEYVKVHQG